MKKRYLKSSCLFVLVLMILAVILPAGVFAQPEVKSTAATGDDAVIGVAYRGHVQNLGNMPTPEGTMIAGPEALGTTGKGLRLEGFWIDLTGDVPANAGIRYQVHVQNVGWQDAVGNGDFAGTKGRGLRIEAIKITLENLPDFDVYYRGHVQNVGNIPQIDGNWGWVKNGEELGTTGKGLRLEELQIKIVRKGVDLTAYNTLLGTIEKLDAANYSPESWATLQTALTQNQMTEANSQTRIDASTQAIQAAYDGLSLKVLAVYDKPGIYGPETGTQTIEGSVVIAVSGVTLQNLVIKGDLTVSEAVGDGNATLKNLTVEGATILAGGGTGGAALAALATSGDEILTQSSGGITIDGGFLNKVLIKKNDHGGIRITIIDSFLESFEVIDIPEGQPIILSGAFKDVMVQAPDINLELATGTTVMHLIAGINDPQRSASGLVVSGGGFIDRFEVGELSDNVSVGQNVSILHAIIEGDNAQFNGNVTDANITGDNAGFRYPPLGYTGNPPVIINPPAPPPGGGGGGDTTAPTFTATYPKAGAAQADGSKQVEVLVKTDEAGTAYYVVVADGAVAPTAAQVMAGKGTGDQAALKEGNGSITANTEKSFIPGALAADATAYDVYVVVKDSSNNATAATKVDVTTPQAAMAPSIAQTAYNFDKNPTAQADVSIVGTLGTGGVAATTIDSVTGNGITSSNYTITDGTVVLKKEYLVTLSTGEKKFNVIFNNSANTSVEITVTVADTASSVPSITTTTYNFDKNPTAQADVSIVGTLGTGGVAATAIDSVTGNEITSSDYTITDGTVVLNKGYLFDLPYGDQKFNVIFNDSANTSVEITVTVANSNADLIIEATGGSSSTTIDNIQVIDDPSSSGETAKIDNPICLKVELGYVPPVSGVSFSPVTNGASVSVFVDDLSTPSASDFMGLMGSNVQLWGSHYLWVKVVSQDQDGNNTKYYKIDVQY